MATKKIDPKPDRFPADNHTARSQKVFDISRAKRQPVIRPYSIRNDLTRIAKALQARNIRWNFHWADLLRTNPANNLAIPHEIPVAVPGGIGRDVSRNGDLDATHSYVAQIKVLEPGATIRRFRYGFGMFHMHNQEHVDEFISVLHAAGLQ